MRKKSLIIIATIFILDQITKFIIVKKFYLGESLPVIKNIFHITYITNTGTAFGMFQKYGNILLVFSVVAVILISILIYKRKRKEISKINLIAFSFILGGAVGNLIDRIFRGEIVDFLDFRIWPVFNIADSAITIGIVIMGTELTWLTCRKFGTSNIKNFSAVLFQSGRSFFEKK